MATRLPSLVGWSPPPANTMPASASFSLYWSIATKSSGVPNSPASDCAVALPRTMTFIDVLLHVCPGIGPIDQFNPGLPERRTEKGGFDTTLRLSHHQHSSGAL